LLPSPGALIAPAYLTGLPTAKYISRFQRLMRGSLLFHAG
jgi:hypothetical protein